jgi:hypothetical protein
MYGKLIKNEQESFLTFPRTAGKSETSTQNYIGVVEEGIRQVGTHCRPPVPQAGCYLLITTQLANS